MSTIFSLKRLALLVLCVPLVAAADRNLPQGSLDPRIRVVDYNPADVVQLTTFYGVSTHVGFGQNETIKDVAIGDEQAWSVVPRGNNLFVKPKAPQADTNITVVTNKRVYHFALVVEPRSVKDPGAWRDRNLVFSLSFRYPQDEAERITAQAQADEEKARKADVSERMVNAKRHEENRDYWVAGSQEITPTAARDDGRFIYLTFANNGDMPAVYAVDEEGQESLINTNVEGNAIVVQRLVRQLTLRKGNAVACVVNRSFDVAGGRDNATGTVASDVERIIKENR